MGGKQLIDLVRHYEVIYNVKTIEYQWDSKRATSTKGNGSDQYLPCTHVISVHIGVVTYHHVCCLQDPVYPYLYSGGDEG